MIGKPWFLGTNKLIVVFFNTLVKRNKRCDGCHEHTHARTAGQARHSTPRRHRHWDRRGLVGLNLYPVRATRGAVARHRRRPADAGLTDPAADHTGTLPD